MAHMCGCGGQCRHAPCPRGQAQTSVTDQLAALVTLANQHGLYDAADYLTGHLARNDPDRRPAMPA